MKINPGVFPTKTDAWTPAAWYKRLRKTLSSDLGVLLLLSLGWGILLTITIFVASRQYGFHRDELALLDNSQYLGWGYVDYPPLVPFLAQIEMALFGLSPVGIRSFPILAACLVLLLTGLMAHELGASRKAQIVAGLAAVSAPLLLFNGLFLSYSTFDYLWWVVIAYFMIRLLKSEDPRWWLGIGMAIGLGAMTKYSIAYLMIGIAAGVLFTPARRYLKSPWLWAGAALAALIVLPNLVWQAQHQWITIRFTSSIHIRDIGWGRTSLLSFLSSQFYVNTNAGAIALWMIGFGYCARSAEGRRFRTLAWMAAVPFGLFLVSQGRFYYPAPIYPMLIAAGSYQVERMWETLSGKSLRRWRGWQYRGLAVSSLLGMAVTLPLAPVNSVWWQISAAANGEIREEIGWQELVQIIAGIRDSLPDSERAGLGILAGNYGEAGAINLYGPTYGLPTAISGMNTYWLRGYGDPPPQTLIVVGFPEQELKRIFLGCQAAGQITNRFGIQNVESGDDPVVAINPVIYICRNLRQPWPEFWKSFQYFG